MMNGDMRKADYGVQMKMRILIQMIGVWLCLAETREKPNY